MAFKMGQFPEDSCYKTDLHSKKRGGKKKLKKNLKKKNQSAAENDGVL